MRPAFEVPEIFLEFFYLLISPLTVFSIPFYICPLVPIIGGCVKRFSLYISSTDVFIYVFSTSLPETSRYFDLTLIVLINNVYYKNMSRSTYTWTIPLGVHQIGLRELYFDFSQFDINPSWHIFKSWQYDAGSFLLHPTSKTLL